MQPWCIYERVVLLIYRLNHVELLDDHLFHALHFFIKIFGLPALLFLSIFQFLRFFHGGAKCICIWPNLVLLHHSAIFCAKFKRTAEQGGCHPPDGFFRIPLLRGVVDLLGVERDEVANPPVGACG